MEATMSRTCAHEGCDERTAGKSRYCKIHRTLARTAWKERISAQAEEREARYAEFRQVWADALAAGSAAGQGAKPQPMVVMGTGFPEPDGSVVDVVMDGACGFAWVTVYPATCSFSRFAVKHLPGWSVKHYGSGGAQYWVSAFGQSVTRKERAAEAIADVLRSRLGLKAYADSRLD